MKVIDEINSSKDIKNLSIAKMYRLSDEIREFLTDNISNTGGHLASNLGVVELTIALHKVFNFPYDKIIFDVGHQSYVHKILTGRKDRFSTLRKYNGLSGFPKVKESEYDCFDTGHSSNSLSIALGMKRASLLKGEDRNVIALLGDGSFVGGMVYEAINDAGHNKDNIIVILNDNQMSISKNQSSISKYLNRIRVTSSYIDAKNKASNFFSKLPLINKCIKAVKGFFKRILIDGSLFEDLGFNYYGPYDGHNIKDLIRIFENVKKINEPVLIHILTKKGKGYSFAETNPEKFHGISKFNVKTGEKLSSMVDYSKVFGEELVNISEKNDKIVAVTAAMTTGTGLIPFAKKFKNRFFDVGICEQHAVSLCGGMAACGLIPVFPIYSSFLQRGYDQIITDVALMNLHVIFAIDRAGLVGEDGETHQGTMDISYLNAIPNLTIMSPASFKELRMMLNFAINDLKGPVAIRYPKGGEGAVLPVTPEIEKCKGVLLHCGNDITIVAEGRMVSVGLELCSLISNAGKSADLINIRFIKPLDEDIIRNSVQKTKNIVVLEEGVQSGGLGQTVLTAVNDLNAKTLLKYLPDKFIEHGTVEELFIKYDMDSQSIFRQIKEVFGF